jgi:murein DD-endopeptidase MepM/ murein hydrolase activator NlpD
MSYTTYRSFGNELLPPPSLIFAPKPSQQRRLVYRGLNFLLFIQVGLVILAMSSPTTLAVPAWPWLPRNFSRLATNQAPSSPQGVYASVNEAQSAPAINPYLATPAPTPPPVERPATINTTSRPQLRYDMIAPLESNGITQRFRAGGHTGVDYRASVGTPVNAAAHGKVIEAKTSGWNGGWGKTILVDHGNGKTSRYAHLSKLRVEVGDTVTQGQIIGNSGNTGYSTGPHLHFEVRVNNIPKNPFI